MHHRTSRCPLSYASHYASTPLTAVNDSRQPRKAKAAASRFVYGIERKDGIARGGKSAGRWLVGLMRRGSPVRRAFSDQVLGGREEALALAIAWRNAALRLIPPNTKLQVLTCLRRHNTSGITGVTLVRRNGQPIGWKAALKIAGICYRKTFSFRLYGERAKELAIAERQRLLDEYSPATFATFNAKATQEAVEHFGFLLNDAQPPATFTPAQFTERICALDQWFEQLHPERFYVRLKVHRHSRKWNTDQAAMRITSFGAQKREVFTNFSLATRSYQQRLPELWQFIEDTITAWHGRQCWLDFAARHASAFMSSSAQNGFQARHYSAPPNYPECLKPPAALLPMLAGFELPALPYWALNPQPPAGQTSHEGEFLQSNAPQSQLAILPPAVKTPYGNSQC